MTLLLCEVEEEEEERKQKRGNFFIKFLLNTIIMIQQHPLEVLSVEGKMRRLLMSKSGFYRNKKVTFIVGSCL